jgi:septal ring-binding cell division protein DamX
MPKLNLKDDGFEEEEEQNPLDADDTMSPPPTLREVGGGGAGGGKSNTLLIVILIVALLVLGAFALNYFKVIHLWGKKVPKVTAQFDNTLPMPDQTPINPAGSPGSEQTQEGSEQATTPTPTPEPTLENTPPTSSGAPASQTSQSPPRSSPPRTSPAPSFVPPASSGTGSYTVQVSSWTSKAYAEQQASRLNAAGMSAFVEDVVIAGENWYRVRVGHYETPQEAKEAAEQLSRSLEGRIWVARLK